jgi:ParB family transcriptional regulator, chromosome partitioning protein
MARKGIFSDDLVQTSTKPAVEPRRANLMPRGAVGALQSSMAKMQESAVQDVDAKLIDDAGLEDRLGIDPAAQRQLMESLQQYGQQVPVLLRPHPKQSGRYEIVYGRRRLRALRELGMPVKAMIRQLDDHALVMAQGQENTSRQDLSFIEKASFAAQLQTAGYDRATIAAALSIDLPMVSRLLKVGTAFPLPFLRKIGSAPGIGRDRWLALAKALEAPGAQDRVTAAMDAPKVTMMESDARFEHALKHASPPARTPKAAPKPTARTLRSADGKALAELRQSPRGVTLNIAAKTAEGFDIWLAEQAEDVIQELHDRWIASRSEDHEQ